MEVALVAVFVLVVMVCLAIPYIVQRWGPWRAIRTVQCPEWGMDARITVVPKKGATEGPVLDILACSLFPGQRLPCKKECMRQL
ncbi:MAG: hypothetical protein ACE5HB_04865 [Terriglobia bacterium]